MSLQIETQPFQFNKSITALSSISAVALSGTFYGDGSNLTGISNYNGSDIKALTGNWNSTYTTVSSNSSNWQTGYNNAIYNVNGTANQITVTPAGNNTGNNSVTVSLPSSVNVSTLNVLNSLNVAGSANFYNTNNLNVSSNIIYYGEGNTGNTLDLGLVTHFVGNLNNGQNKYQHTGLVRKAGQNSPSIWTLFSGLTTEPGDVSSGINWSDPYLTLDTLSANVLGNLSGSYVTVGGGNSNQWNSAYTVATTYQNASGSFATNTTLQSTSALLTPLTLTNTLTGSLYSTLQSTSALLTPLTTTNTLTSQLVLNTAINSVSGNWNTAYTSINVLSAVYTAATTLVDTNSAIWNNSYTALTANSANWNTAYTAYNTNSASLVAATSVVDSTSGIWNSTWSTVNSNSAVQWNYQGNDLKTLSGGWQTTYATVSSLSGGWGGSASGPLTFNSSTSSTNTAIGANSATGIFSAVHGGVCNTASGNYSTIIDGFSSCATGYATFVGAGSGIRATGNYAVAVGGKINTVSGAYSSIINGTCNTASASNSLIGQGRFNFTNQYNSNIGGGLYNNIGGCSPLFTNISNVSGNGTCSLISNTLNTCYGFTTNGDTIGIVWTTASNPLSSACFTTGTIVCVGASGSPYNTIISGDYSKCTASSLSAVCMFVFDRSVCSGAFCGSFVGGGSLNTASGNYNTVVGGQCNFASCGIHNTIGGGWANYIFCGSCNTISGGRNNIISVANAGNSNTISGGYSNQIQAGGYNFIGSGGSNSHTGKSYLAVIGGGRSNTASGCYSSILGGAFNCACCLAGCSVVGGGCRNTVTSNYASVFGGACNTASGAYSFVAAGSANTAGYNNTFILGSSLSASAANYTYVNNLSSQGVLYGQCLATGSVITGNTTTQAGCKIQIFSSTGTSLGYIQVYSS